MLRAQCDREYLIDQIHTERAMQDAQWGPAHDDQHSPADWQALIHRHAALMLLDGGQVDMDRYRRQLVRVAALAVAALEAFDRRYPELRRLNVPDERRPGSPGGLPH